MSKLPPPINIEGMSLEAINEAIQDCHDWPGMKHPSDHRRLAMRAACEAMRLEGDLEAAQQEIAARDAEIAKMQEQFRDYVERSESDAMELRKEIADLRAIPADRVLGEGMVGVDHRELNALREIRASVIASIHGQQGQGGKFHLTRRLGDSLDASHVPPVLRANQGGAAT